MPKQSSKIFFLCIFIYAIVYIGLGAWMAWNSHDGNFSFAVFQSYRIVFNNLHFPQVTGWNAMTHPANAKELHLYSTLFAPAYAWWISLWGYLTELSPKMLRIGSVLIYFPPILLGSLSLARRCGGNPWLSGLIFLTAPLFILHSIACDWIVFSLGFVLLVYSEWLKEQPSSKLLAFWAFLSVFFQFLNAIHLAMFILILWIWERMDKPNKCKVNFGHILPLFWGISSALVLAWICRQFADSSIMPFSQYMRTRGQQAILEPQGLSFYLFTLERVWGQMSYNFPAFILFLISLGCVFQSTSSSVRSFLLVAVITHFAYCSLLTATTAAHYFYSFFYILLLPAFLSHAWASKARTGLRFWIKVAPLLVIFIVLSAYELRKNGFWTPQASSLDTFLLQMKPKDLLIRDEWFNTWPLNYNNPLNTIYLDPMEASTSDRDPFRDLKIGKVYGYDLTWNTAFHVRPKYQNWRAFEREPSQKIYYVTQRNLNFPLVCKSTLDIIHEGKKNYYVYEVK